MRYDSCCAADDCVLVDLTRIDHILTTYPESLRAAALRSIKNLVVELVDQVVYMADNLKWRDSARSGVFLIGFELSVDRIDILHIEIFTQPDDDPSPSGAFVLKLDETGGTIQVAAVDRPPPNIPLNRCKTVNRLAAESRHVVLLSEKLPELISIGLTGSWSWGGAGAPAVALFGGNDTCFRDGGAGAQTRRNIARAFQCDSPSDAGYDAGAGESAPRALVFVAGASGIAALEAGEVTLGGGRGQAFNLRYAVIVKRSVLSTLRGGGEVARAPRRARFADIPIAAFAGVNGTGRDGEWFVIFAAPTGGETLSGRTCRPASARIVQTGAAGDVRTLVGQVTPVVDNAPPYRQH